MHVKTDGVSSDFERAITSNGEALSIYNAMLPAEREAFRRRCENAKSQEELKSRIDELVGWKTGHPPYQL